MMILAEARIFCAFVQLQLKVKVTLSQFSYFFKVVVLNCVLVLVERIHLDIFSPVIRWKKIMKGIKYKTLQSGVFCRHHCLSKDFARAVFLGIEATSSSPLIDKHSYFPISDSITHGNPTMLQPVATMQFLLQSFCISLLTFVFVAIFFMFSVSELKCTCYCHKKECNLPREHVALLHCPMPSTSVN